MILSKNIDKALEEIFDFCKKVYFHGAEKGKYERLKDNTSQEAMSELDCKA